MGVPEPRRDVLWFASLMEREAAGAERGGERTEETVEELASRLLDDAGAVYEAYLEDVIEPADRTRRACARVANRAMSIAESAVERLAETMAPAVAAGRGPARPFRRDERASMNSVSDSNPDLMLDDPAIQGTRPVFCECNHATIAEHNAAVTDLEMGRA